jgi:hypothetical protein
MAIFDISFMRVDGDNDPTVIEGFFRTAGWAALTRDGVGLDMGAKFDPTSLRVSGGR